MIDIWVCDDYLEFVLLSKDLQVHGIALEQRRGMVALTNAYPNAACMIPTYLV